MKDDKEKTIPIVQPMESNLSLKEYRCPYCEKFLFKGNVHKLNMVCHHCQEMINVDEDDHH